MGKKILFCINNLKIGGAEILLIDLINNWPSDYCVHLILLSETNYLEELLNKDKIKEIIYFPRDNSSLKNIFEVNKIFKSRRIDYCFSHLERPNKICLIAGIFSKTTVLPVIHSINIYNSIPRFNSNIAKFIYKLFANKIIVISSAVNSYCKTWLGFSNKKLIQIDNGIDFKRLKRYERKCELNIELKLAVLGRMEHVKGYDILLKSLANSKVKNKKWTLKMIGDGSELENLKELVKELGIESKVEFLGFQKFPFTFLTDVHFLAMPSRREGLPISLLEALSFGIPTIASNIGVLPTFIKDGENGFIFESENVNILSEKLLFCFEKLNMDYEKMSKKAKESVSDYSINNCIKNYENLLK